jgi:Zn-dependent protease
MSTQKDDGSKKTLFGSLGILGVVALKFKFYIFAAFKALTFIKFGWLLSPLLSIGLYTMLWGWQYAIAIVLLLFIHEMGHWIWMKCLGLQPKAPVFIPGFGAYVAMTKLPPDQATHAWVALAGPLVGGVGAVMLFYAGIQTGNHWMTAAGSTGFFLNLLQLVPAKPLDGGFVIQAVSKWLLIPGTGLLCALAAMFQSILLLIIAGISFFSLLKQFLKRQPVDAYGVPIVPADQQTLATVPQRILIAIAYLGLAGMLGYLYWLSTNELISFVPKQ